MGERRGMKALELWCRRITKGYPGVRITNMTTSWRNGLGFCAIIHHFRPDLIDFDSLTAEDVYKNNALAFETAETSLSVPALLDPQDMVDYEVPDRLSILTYVSQFYQAFVGQTGIPRKSASVSEASSPEPVSPPPDKHVATSVRQREPCSVCALPVFLAERMLIERRLVHRTCFKCARCSSQLSTANYYITEDGQFCCEVCPDEEIGGRVDKTAAVLEHERAVLAGPVDDPLALQADAVLDAVARDGAVCAVPTLADSSDSESDSGSDSDASNASGPTGTVVRTNNADGVATGDVQSVSEDGVGDAAQSVNEDGVGDAAQSVSEDGVGDAAQSVNEDGVGDAAQSVSEDGVGDAAQSVNEDGVGDAAQSVSEGRDIRGVSESGDTRLGDDHASEDPESGDTRLGDDHASEDPESGDTRLGDDHASEDPESGDTRLGDVHASEDLASDAAQIASEGLASGGVQSSMCRDDRVCEDDSCGASGVASGGGDHTVASGAALGPMGTADQSVEVTRSQTHLPAGPQSVSPHTSQHVPASESEPEPELEPQPESSGEQTEEPNREQSRPTERLSLVQQRVRQIAAAERPQPAPRRHQRPSAARTQAETSRHVMGSDRSRSGVDAAGDEVGAEATTEPTGQSGQVCRRPSIGTHSAIGRPEHDPPPAETLNPFDDHDDDEGQLSVEREPASSVVVPDLTPQKPAAEQCNPFDDDDGDEEDPGEYGTSTKEETRGKEETKEDDEYPDDLNPFGEEDEGEKPVSETLTAKPVPKSVSLNPFGDDEEVEEQETEDTAPSSGCMTPTASQQTSPAKAVSSPREINPFEKPPRPPPPTLDRRAMAARIGGSPAGQRRTQSPGMTNDQRSGSLTSLTCSSGKKKRPAPRPPGGGRSPTASLGASPMGSPTTLRKRHAPPPPPGTGQSLSIPAASPPSPERSKAEKEQNNYTKLSLVNKSTEGQYKRRKGPAPLRPKPIKRQVRTLPPKETQTELHDINVKQLELERQGVELEKTIRQLTQLEAKEQKELDSTAPYGLDIEDMILQLFDLVNEKNALFRRQAELMYMRRQHRLEEEHAELEYEIRCLMMKADPLKTDTEREREQRLIDRLVSVVEQRNEIVTMLEMERIREIQEDTAIDYHMAERVGSTEPTPDKKSKKDKKKKKKDKEKKEKERSSKKKKEHDDDKDIDEKEQVTTGKKKLKKIKLKKLFS